MNLDEQRALVAEACRVAAARGLVDGILGHLSLRVDDERLLHPMPQRHRPGCGVHPAHPISGSSNSTAAQALPENSIGYRVPNELPIHVETMLADPRHRAVAHLHPPAVVAADLAGITIRPIYGAYDIPGAWLARGGVPVYERAVLIRNDKLGKEMVAAMRRRTGGDLPRARHHQRGRHCSAGGAAGDQPRRAGADVTADTRRRRHAARNRRRGLG